jgi:hypothetical protein
MNVGFIEKNRIRKAMKYFQLENKMEKAYEFELANKIPLVQ